MRAALEGDQFGEILIQHIAVAGFGETLFGARPGRLVLDRLEHRLRVDAEVPHIEHPHLGEFPHMLPVAARASLCRIARFFRGETVVPSGHHEAGGKPFDIPLPGRRQGLIEVVDTRRSAAVPA